RIAVKRAAARVKREGTREARAARKVKTIIVAHSGRLVDGLRVGPQAGGLMASLLVVPPRARREQRRVSADVDERSSANSEQVTLTPVRPFPRWRPVDGVGYEDGRGTRSANVATSATLRSVTSSTG